LRHFRAPPPGPDGPAAALQAAKLPSLRERPTDLDGRVRLVWKAVTWLQRGKVDPALGLLETLEGSDLDEWSGAVVRGTAWLRQAEAHRMRAVSLEQDGDSEGASIEWAQASQAARDALGDVTLGLTHRTGDMVLCLPDPWLHVVDGFQEYLDAERRRYPAEAAGRPPSSVLQYKGPALHRTRRTA
jgi:hypothetical protein